MKAVRTSKRSHWPLLLGVVALLALRGNAAEPTSPPASPPPPQGTAPSPPPPAETAPVEEKGPRELPPGERGSADNNITFPVDI